LQLFYSSIAIRELLFVVDGVMEDIPEAALLEPGQVLTIMERVVSEMNF